MNYLIKIYTNIKEISISILVYKSIVNHTNTLLSLLHLIMRSQFTKLYTKVITTPQYHNCNTKMHRTHIDFLDKGLKPLFHEACILYLRKLEEACLVFDVALARKYFLAFILLPLTVIHSRCRNKLKPSDCMKLCRSLMEIEEWNNIKGCHFLSDDPTRSTEMSKDKSKSRSKKFIETLNAPVWKPHGDTYGRKEKRAFKLAVKGHVSKSFSCFEQGKLIDVYGEGRMKELVDLHPERLGSLPTVLPSPEDIPRFLFDDYSVRRTIKKMHSSSSPGLFGFHHSLIKQLC